MQKKSILFLVFTISFLLNSCLEQRIEAPKAKKIIKELKIHGDTRIDNYFWLNQRENQDVVAYLNAENKYTKKKLKHTEKVQQKIYDEIVGRIKQTDESVPYLSNGYYYYTKYEEGKEYPIYCRKEGSLESKEEVLLNVNEMADGYKYYAVRSLNVSPDNQILAFALDTVSRRKYNILFKDLKTGKIIDSGIINSSGGTAWANDNKTLFYTLKDPETLRSYKIMKHRYASKASNDVPVYEEKDTEFSSFVFKTKSKEYIIIGSYLNESQEYRIISANKPDSKPELFHPRESGLEYSVDHYKDNFFIRTNYNATNYRLMSTGIKRTNKKYWNEVIPNRSDILLEGIEIFNNYLVIKERKEGLLQLRVKSWDTNEDYYLDFGEPAYQAYLTQNEDFNTKTLRYSYSSLTTPSSTFDFQMDSKEKELKKQEEIVGGYNQVDYKTERLYATAKDGSKIPISLVYKKSLQKDKNPLLLYAYGSYGNSLDASFGSDRLSLLDRGFIYAIAHIRGGMEMGRHWYDQGRLLNKMNTFTDYIDCAEYLISEKLTSSDQLFAYGGSAGGLLMGAVMNIKGDIFKGVVAAVPFVDVVTTMLDESIPLTTFEYKEWGNPNDSIYYHYMKSYSPYDNVQKKAYPATLVTTGFHDSQVQYFEPAKWVAKLREYKTDKNVLLFDCDMESGHGGTTGRFKRYKRTALVYAFMLDLLNKQN
jgi:oligopeptidase B